MLIQTKKLFLLQKKTHRDKESVNKNLEGVENVNHRARVVVIQTKNHPWYVCKISYIDTHTRTYTRTHTHTHTHAHARTHARTHAQTHARTHARTKTHINADARTH